MRDPWVVRLDGAADLSRDMVGGKGWSVNRLRALGMPTPPAVALTIAACRHYQAEGDLPAGAWDALRAALSFLEADTGRRFGGPGRPLLVSVRSGGASSMPGMMDTVLNLGWSDAVEGALATESGDAGFASGTRARFERDFLATVGVAAPADPWAQLRLAARAVFESWNSARAKTYRAHHGLSEYGGTAVTVQAMVFGNLDERSGTGVLFTRNPLTGGRAPFGEWLGRAQGEDVVSGRFTPQPLDAMCDVLPDAHAQLMQAAARLERDGRDVQDIEFTVESGRLWLLQTRAAKRSPRAAAHLAVTLCEEGLIGRSEALARIAPAQVESLRRPQLDPAAVAGAVLLASGEPACPGFASGRVVTDADTAMEQGDDEDLILVRDATSPEDIHGMVAARGIVTATGGATSHAAVVSREIGTPCVVGCGAAVLALEGQLVTVDGGAGKVFAGRLPVVSAGRDDPDLAVLRDWAQAEGAEALAAALA